MTAVRLGAGSIAIPFMVVLVYRVVFYNQILLKIVAAHKDFDERET